MSAFANELARIARKFNENIKLSEPATKSEREREGARYKYSGNNAGN